MTKQFIEELKKLIIVLICGAGLLAAFVYGTEYGQGYYDAPSILMAVDIFFFPLSIVYARKEIIKVASWLGRSVSSLGKDYYAGNYYYTMLIIFIFVIKLIAYVFVILIAVAIGWIIGLYRVTKRLIAAYKN